VIAKECEKLGERYGGRLLEKELEFTKGNIMVHVSKVKCDGFSIFVQPLEQIVSS